MSFEPPAPAVSFQTSTETFAPREDAGGNRRVDRATNASARREGVYPGTDPTIPEFSRMYKHRSPHNRKQARRNLKRIMPLALTRANELEAAGEAISVAASSVLGAAMPPQIRIRNFIGVHLYSLGPGIHHADIELKGMPVGCPNIFGTPVAAPRANQQEAQEWAINTLAHVILSERRCPNPDAPPMAFVPFEIDGMIFSVPRAHIQAASEVGYFEVSRAASHIERIRHLTGGRLTPQGYNMLSAQDAELLNISMVSMLLAGTPRYPHRRPAAAG